MNSEIWAIDEGYLRSMVAMGISPSVAAGSSEGAAGYSMTKDGLAVVRLIGILTKHRNLAGAKTAISRATKDLAVKAIAVLIDSPGGSVAGTKDLADEIAAASKVKPVGAYIEDLGASAAYWVASQAGFVAANESALVGSIGTYGVLIDSSARAAKGGIKVHVVRAGAFKGMITPGATIEKDHLAEYQHTVNSLNSLFVQAISRGRKLGQVRAGQLADGRIHIAGEAHRLGLIDGVMSYKQFLEKVKGCIHG